MIKFVSILFIFAVALMIYNTGLFESCSCDTEEENHADPVCENDSCLFCTSGLIGIDVTSQNFNILSNSPRPYSFSENTLKPGEIVTELDQPPRA